MAEKKVDLLNLVNNELPVLVINNTRPRGILVLPFVTDTGRTIDKTIPATGLPFRIDDEVPHEFIKKSFDFKRLIKKGVLILVDPDEALERLGTPRAQRELRKLTRSAFAGTGEMLEEIVEEVTEEEDAGSGKIYPRVLGIVSELRTGELKVRDALDELESLEEQKYLGMTDFRFVIAETTKKTVQDWARTQITKE